MPDKIMVKTILSHSKHSNFLLSEKSNEVEILGSEENLICYLFIFDYPLQVII